MGDAGYDISKATALDELAEMSERSPNHEDYKHEGDSVNNEMKVSKKRIEFNSGDRCRRILRQAGQEVGVHR